MDLTDSHQLLRDYADHGNESAFQELVNRYIDLVYSTALRRVGGNANTAQDVTQTVFTDLARKAQSLRSVDMLGGWLHRHTGFVASNLVRSEQRRQIREQEAAQMNALQDSPDALWQQLSPVLDETIDSLEPADRQAILLRFFERHDFRSIGATLGISDDAAQKRVSRALDKLKDLLARRGVTLTVVLLGSLMAGKVVKAAPGGLAVKVATLALAGARVVGVTATLAKVANSLAFKIALAAIVVATAAKLILSSHSAPRVETVRQGNAGVPAVTTQTVSTPAPDTQASSALPNTSSNLLALTIVSADSGQPIPNVQVDYWAWVDGKLAYWTWGDGNVKKPVPLLATGAGNCAVPVPDGTTKLIVLCHADGLADTRLQWEPNHGQTIPVQYTLRVARAVPIGGRVLDPDGNPVAGAGIVFNNQPDPALDAHVETDDFGWAFFITTKTDAEGRWQINRIGKDAIHTIYGLATHPDYVSSEQVYARDSNVEKRLLTSTCDFSLGRAVAVRGIVRDPNAQPIPGAKVLIGHNGEPDRRETNCQADGTFSVSGCRPGKNVVTAEAKGYAATTFDVDLADNSTPLQLVLRPANLLKLKAVDPDGNPIPKVWLGLAGVASTDLSPMSSTPAQVEFSGKTGTDGRLEWDSAPGGVLIFSASADGYMQSDNNQFRADGTEHVITMQPGLTISGTVLDATTGQPVPRFRVIAGAPVENPAGHSTNAEWSGSDRDWLTFDGGRFEHTFQGSVLVVGSDVGVLTNQFMFKFDAEGYAPFVSRVVNASERNVELNVTLTPAASSTVTVLLSNGQPEAAADIGLVGPRTWLKLVPGGFSGGSFIRADSQGQFQLPPDSELTRVIAATPEGYAEATPEELASNPSMHLQPWGRLEGTCFGNGQPAANQSLCFQLGIPQESIQCDPIAFRTETDKDGRFVFPQLPPGDREVMLFTPSTGQLRPLRPVTIHPGQTTTVTVDTSEMPNDPPPTANR